jgi:hypothetical protein
MASLQELLEREMPCRRCKGQFRIALPVSWEVSEKLARVLAVDRIGLIAEIQRATGCTLADAKGTMEHFAIKPGTCHWCASPLGSNEAITDCPRCRSLNLQLQR